MLNFEPRRLQPSKPTLKSQPPQQPDGLKAENPWLPRTVDLLHVSAEFAEVAVPHRHQELIHHPVHAAHAISGLGAAIWGINKLAFGETGLDRVEAVASLSLAAESALAAAGGALPGVGLALSVLHGAGEMIVGAADLRRGQQEGSMRRGAAGAFQLLTGAGVLISHLVPGCRAVGGSLMMVGMLARQVAISSPPS